MTVCDAIDIDGHGAGCCIVRNRDRVPLLEAQRRLRNHGDIADLSGGALSTARVMTCLNELGEFEPVIAVYRMAVDNANSVDD